MLNIKFTHIEGIKSNNKNEILEKLLYHNSNKVLKYFITKYYNLLYGLDNILITTYNKSPDSSNIDFNITNKPKFINTISLHNLLYK